MCRRRACLRIRFCGPDIRPALVVARWSGFALKLAHKSILRCRDKVLLSPETYSSATTAVTGCGLKTHKSVVFVIVCIVCLGF